MTPTFAAARWRARLVRHHLPLALGCALSVGALMAVGGGRPVARLSLATAYVALALLAATLAIGPVYALQRRRVPASMDLRRDLGIWTALVATAHAGAGAFVHLASPLLYVFRPDAFPDRLVLRADAFGAANYAGIAATLVALVLVATSSDAAIRRLGARRWKRVQQSAYALLVLTAGHGAAYQLLEGRAVGSIAVFAALVLGTAALQLAGVAVRRQGATRAVETSPGRDGSRGAP